jgi:hypothetical protein
MKKFLFIAAAVAIMLYGCSDNSDPLGPLQTSAHSPGGVLGKASTQTTAADAGLFVPGTITASQRLTASLGGKVALKGSYVGMGGQTVTYDICITFQAGELPVDTVVSITIDKSTFEQTAEMQFGPEGTVFNGKGYMKVSATGIVIAMKNAQVVLYYLDNGAWVPMPGSGGTYKCNNGGSVNAYGKLPHFSRYAFGR